MSKKKTSIKILEFDKWLSNTGVLGQRGTDREVDEIDGAIRDAARMKIRKVKMLELDKYLLETQNEMNKAKASMESYERKTSEESQTSEESLLSLAQSISELDPDEQSRVMQAYAYLKSLQKGAKESVMLPLIMGYSKANPRSKPSDMVVFAKAMTDQFQSGIKLAKETSSIAQRKTSDPITLLKAMSDLIKDGVERPLEKAVAKLQPQPSAFEQILLNPQLFNRATEMGIFGGVRDKTSSNEMDFKIEELKGNRQLEIERMRLENQKMHLESAEKARRQDTIIQTFMPIAATFAEAYNERTRQNKRQTVANPNPNLHTTPNPGISPTMLTINCDQCGHTENKALMGPLPDTVICPQCSSELKIVQGTPPGGVRNG